MLILSVSLGVVVPVIVAHRPANRTFLDEMLKSHERQRSHSVETYKVHHPSHRPEHLAAIIDRHAAADAVFTADTGMCCTWVARPSHITVEESKVPTSRHPRSAISDA
jgi:pyruvate dehydrogenase (quinone)